MPSPVHDSFSARSRLQAGGGTFTCYRIGALDRAGVGAVHRLPWSLRILLENLLRHEDGITVTRDDIAAVAAWQPAAAPRLEIAFRPARVLLQDFTGVPAVADLAAMRDALVRMGGDPARINPIQPADLVIDHSVQVDVAGVPDAFRRNAELEFDRNRERYVFLRWGQEAFRNFRVVPPDTGIVHQVNLEHLAQVVFRSVGNADGPVVYPDTLVGTDSHTTMINGLGVVGWGVGGIEAEAAMLGQPISMLLPQVVGFRLSGRLPEGATATDLVLTVTQRLRAHGVVGRFVEFFGPGLDALSLPDRATLANMAPEYGATIGFVPVDAETLSYLRLTGRPADHIALVETYCREQGIFREAGTPDPEYTNVLHLDLATVEPSLAGPKRPQDRIPLSRSKEAFRRSTAAMIRETRPDADTKALDAWAAAAQGGQAGAGARDEEVRPTVEVPLNGGRATLRHGSVVIAAITSCTNTSNPAVMVGAGLLARKARERGLTARPWVKTSLAPGSQVVMDYLEKSGLDRPLEELGFHLVGYGCTTCIGNSGPLPEPVAGAIREHGLIAASVLSGNRNFEGRINPHVRANYLASPPLVVAYAIAGDMDIDFRTDPIGRDPQGREVFLRDIWPTPQEIRDVLASSIDTAMFTSRYEAAWDGDARWRGIEVPTGDTFSWDDASTYVRRPPFFDAMPAQPVPSGDIRGARVLALLGDSVTTDHISPAGSIPADGPAGAYLVAHGVKPADFNSFGSRRGNHEVMVRGTFGNIRLRNRLVPGTEGGWTIHLPDGRRQSIYDAAQAYRAEGTPLIVIAGKEYGTGSSRDWAAKGTMLLGVRAVLAESFERIHRSNLAGMGVLPLQFEEGAGTASLGLTGHEGYTITGLDHLEPGGTVEVSVDPGDGGAAKTFRARLRLDTPREVEYFLHGGILPYVLRNLLAS